LDRDGGPSVAFRFELARKAFAHTAAYDRMIDGTLREFDVASNPPTRHARDAALSLHLSKLRDLRYGENPHQRASWYAGGDGQHPWQVTQGKELSYTNLLDLDAAARIAIEFSEPAAVVIKHTNPCGVATGSDAADAYVRAWRRDWPS
jgi:phosphoribosylaminoimidazolecarboxamide formyltransferase/IMP cyclohydrolase